MPPGSSTHARPVAVSTSAGAAGAGLGADPVGAGAADDLGDDRQQPPDDQHASPRAAAEMPQHVDGERGEERDRSVLEHGEHDADVRSAA